MQCMSWGGWCLHRHLSGWRLRRQLLTLMMTMIMITIMMTMTMTMTRMMMTADMSNGKLEFNFGSSAGVDSGHQLASAPAAMQILSLCIYIYILFLSQLVHAPAAANHCDIILDI